MNFLKSCNRLPIICNRLPIIQPLKYNYYNNYYNNYRTLKTININNITETIVERDDYPLDKCHQIINNQSIGIIGYGPQGRGQSLNLRDNGFNINIGVRKGPSYDLAVKDGWVPDHNLYSIEETAEKSDIIKYLLSDVGQITQWDIIKPYLTENKTLYFSHGFGITYNEKTNIIPPDNIDVILVAPKGAGLTVRNKFLEGKGINVSYAIHQDYTNLAKEKCLALAFGLGCGHAFETTFEKEVYSDLVGERCVLMGLIQGAFLAQYNVLRNKGHGPIEAYNETVEEALESLFPLISNQGMDWLYSNCSTTAQRGALDWAPRFEQNLTPLIEECYREVENGSEANRAIYCNSKINYRENLNKELEQINNQELWQIAKELRNYRV
jgi:ketol-acid reductoisomerase